MSLGIHMTFISRIKSLNLSCCGLVVAALALVGCNREQIKVEQVPKDSDSATTAAAAPDNGAAPSMPMDNPHAGMDMGGGSDAQLGFVLPDGWEKKPVSQMRAASFSAPGKDGQGADVAVIPLPSGGPEMELAPLNMWRKELQLPDASRAESVPVSIGSSQGKLYEISGGKPPERIMVAVLARGGTSWYFKMRGEDATVREQKPAFLDFLKSISFEAAPTTTAMNSPMANPNVMPSVAADPNAPLADAGVPLPAGWKQVPAPAGFLVAKYDIEGSGGAKADVNVSALAGEGGGMMMNINRWRGQLGLSHLSEEDYSKEAQTMDIGGSRATVVDLTGIDAKTSKKARLIGVIAPQTGETWFYKLMGDEQIVEQQKDAFTKFVRTAKFSNAP